MGLDTLFGNHVAERQQKLAKALSAAGFDRLVVSSGSPFTYFADDQDAPFHAVDHFSHWCPLDGPHHVLVLEPGSRPRLLRYAPEDYWYEPATLGSPFWLPEFDIEEAGTVDDAWKRLGSLANAAYVGNEIPRAEAAGLSVNPEKLVARLDWDRGYKSDYELQCLDEASELGAKGHVAAKAAFDSGASELEIHYAFVRALGQTDPELPYHTIVALNEKAAFLHYDTKRAVGDGKVLLIDAGGQVRGYASDITRTHAASDCDERFVALLAGMDALQQELCAEVEPGLAFGKLHHQAHLKIARLLEQSELVYADPEEAVSLGLSRPFFPHGLGHHLGLQVHDVGGHLASASGEIAPPPEQHPFLRNTRTIEAGHVFTIEPGLYFIEMLLRDFRTGEHSERFNWTLIDELAPLGGIRVEDNVVVTESGHRNLTRAHLP
jgi:Xaa-Pro dipeptidase